MSVKSTKKTEWYKGRVQRGCEICGYKQEHLKNNGLELCHIVEPKNHGTSGEYNCLLLCPNCHVAFDNVIKRAVYIALHLNKWSEGYVPESWRVGGPKTVQRNYSRDGK